jgi:ribosome maturation factor RimP
MAVVDRVHELVAPIVADAGVDLYDIEFSGGILRILVDVEGGIDIDAIKSISRRSSRILDEVDPIPGRYTLEVSSPGLERPLRTRQHFEGAIGAVVKFKTHIEVEGRRRFHGTLVGADPDGFRIDLDGIEQVFSYDDVTKAKTVFEWNSTPKPGSSSKSVGGGVNPDHSNQEAN